MTMDLMHGIDCSYDTGIYSEGYKAPILQNGIGSLVENYSAKIREQDKKLKRRHHRHQYDDRRGHKYHRRSHSNSRNRSRSRDKHKMRALEVKSWKDFLNSGFTFDIFRKFKKIETEEKKEKDCIPKTKKRHSDSRSDGKNQHTETTILSKTDKENRDQEFRYNLLDGKRELRKFFKVKAHQGNTLKDFPSSIIQHTKSKPVIKYSLNPEKASNHFQSRQQMFATLVPEIEVIVHKFFSSMRPIKLKENLTDNLIDVNEKLLATMYDENIYPFKGWWPKLSFIVTEIKEDKDGEVDYDALLNKFTTSKQTKKSVSLPDTAKELFDRSFIQSLSSTDKKLRKIKKSCKKSKKTKRKKSKKKNNKNMSNKKPEDEKYYKAFNVEIKKRQFDSAEPKQKKRKWKHEKKEYNSNEENENTFEKLGECSKEKFKKLATNEKVGNWFHYDNYEEQGLIEDLHNILKQIESKLLNENDELSNEPLLNDIVPNRQHQYPFATTETNNSDSKNEEQISSVNVEHIAAQEKITGFSNSTELSMSEQHFETNQQAVLQNDSVVKIVSSENKYLDSINLQNARIDLDDNRRDPIFQWIFDWNQLNKSISEINNSEDCRLIDGERLQKKKKSRWDEQVTDDIIVEPQSIVDEGKLITTEMSDYTTEKLKSISFLSNVDTFSEEQYQPNEMTSINYVNDSTEYNYYSESWYNEYEGQQYSFIPVYSELKTIERDQLSPVDYSIYENYDPDYDCEFVFYDYDYNGGDYDNQWKSIDTTDQSTADETLSSIHADEDVLEILSFSDDIYNIENELSNDTINSSNENICITSNIKDMVVKTGKSDSDCCDEQFCQLNQHFLHNHQNPIKYSVADPVLNNITEIKVGVPEKSPNENYSDTDQGSIKDIPIPSRERTYAFILNENGTNLYHTSDNYIAYYAINDKCMVHIANDSNSRDGIENQVRHCFNIYRDGKITEYGISAELISFLNSSNPESGVVSVDDDDGVESDSGDINNNDSNIYDANNDDDSLVGEEFVDSDNESNDSFLNDQHVIEKYGGINISGVEQTVTDINQEKGSNSSEYDSEDSYSSDTSSETSATEYLTSSIETENNDNISIGKKTDYGKESVVSLQKSISIEDLLRYNTFINQRMKIQRLQIQLKQKNQGKLLDTDLVCYSDNMESVKHPLLGNSQSPAISILSKRNKKTCERVTYADGIYPGEDLAVSPTHNDSGRLFSPPKTCKRVTFADGIYPGEDLAASPTHNDSGRLLSPPPNLKLLMREALKRVNCDNGE